MPCHVVWVVGFDAGSVRIGGGMLCLVDQVGSHRQIHHPIRHGWCLRNRARQVNAHTTGTYPKQTNLSALQDQGGQLMQHAVLQLLLQPLHALKLNPPPEDVEVGPA